MKSPWIAFAIVAGTLLLASRSQAQPQCQIGERQELVASDAARGDNFGRAVAMDGQVAVIGAIFDVVGSPPRQAGSAYVFRLTGGTWIQEARLTAADGLAGDRFGESVAVSGNVAIVGAPNVGNTSPSARDGFGAVYVFRFAGGAWRQEAKLSLQNPHVPGRRDKFGFSVSIDNDALVVGANEHDLGGQGGHRGAAFVYRFSGSSWQFEQALGPSDSPIEASFGFSVSIDGDEAAIGTILDDEACRGQPFCWSGSVYIFRYDRVARTWFERIELVPSNPALGVPGDEFGYSVSLNDDTLLVGACHCDLLGESPGSAYVFRRNPIDDTWDQEAKLTASDGQPSDNFGVSVAIRNGSALVGAHRTDPVCIPHDPGCNSGSAYAFEYTGQGVWAPIAKLSPSNAAPSDIFGFSLSINDTFALVGAGRTDRACPDDPGCNSGSSYVFRVDNCNDNSAADTCDIGRGTSQDCNGDAVPDECQQLGSDCNTNGVPDACDLGGGTSDDCNGNFVPDECEQRRGGDVDCDCIRADWVGPIRGTWSIPENWFPPVVPGVSDTNYNYDAVIGQDAYVVLDVDVTVCRLRVSTGAVLDARASIKANLTVTTPGGLINEGRVMVDSARRIKAGGNVVNLDEISIATNGTSGQFEPSQEVTSLVCQGGSDPSRCGLLRLANSQSAIVGSTSPERSLVNGANHRIAGTGKIIGNFQNEGLVEADNSAGLPLIIDGLDATLLQNGSVIRATTGVVRIGGRLNQTPLGELTAQGGNSKIEIGGQGLTPAVVTDGKIIGNPGQVIMGNRARIRGVTDVTIQGILTIPGVDDFCSIEGTITNDGAIKVDDPSGLWNATLATFSLLPDEGEATLRGNGSVDLLDEERAFLDSRAPYFPQVTNESDHTIRGTGKIRCRLVNNGIVRAEILGKGGTRLTIENPGTRVAKINNGRFEAIRFGELAINAPVTGRGRFIAQNGTMTLGAGGSIEGDTLEVSEVLDGGEWSGGEYEQTAGTALFMGRCSVESCPGGARGCAPPVRRKSRWWLFGLSFFTVRSDITFTGLVDVGIESEAILRVGGSFNNQSTSPDTFEIAGMIVMESPPARGGEGGDRLFELAGRDLGRFDANTNGVFDGFESNFAVDRLIVESNARVRFADDFDNVPDVPDRPCETLYVRELRLTAGAQIIVDGCTVYYRILEDFDAEIESVNGGRLIDLSRPPSPADIDGDGDRDGDDISLFVGVLVGRETNPNFVEPSDCNTDGRVDALDIPRFVQLVLGL